ncbi:MAG: FliM/FliN family flagellar motor C-terminal domain-containing protein [Parvularculaceae bacterium]
MGKGDRISVERIPLDLTVLIGAVDMPLGAARRLERGAVIPLGRRVDAPLEVRAGDARVATAKVRLRGEKVAIEILSVARGRSPNEAA